MQRSHPGALHGRMKAAIGAAEKKRRKTMRLINVSDLMFTSTADIQSMLYAARVELYAIPQYTGEYYATLASIKILECALEQRKRNFSGPKF
jgi:hypothetical protein